MNTQPDSSQTRELWMQQYRARAVQNPWILILVNAEFTPGEVIQVVAYPDVEARIKLGTMSTPVEDSQVQVPRIVISEILPSDNAHELRSALTVIRASQGIDLCEGLLELVHMFVWYADWARSRAGEPPLLEGITFGDLPDGLRDDDDTLMRHLGEHPITKVDGLLSLWRSCQGSLIHGIAKPRDGVPGLPSYAYFPPHWLSVEDLQRMYGSDAPVPKIPVQMDADIAPFLPQVVGFLKIQNPFRDIALKDTTCSKDTATDALCPERSASAAFRHWGDFRGVELNGVEYTLSPAQAAAVRVLYEAAQNGEPVLTSAALFARMEGLAPTRLSDILRNDDARRVLIQRVGKDSYRLNL